MIKNCSTCSNKKGITLTFGTCMYTGENILISREYGCGFDYKGWQPKQGIIIPIKQIFFGVKNA